MSEVQNRISARDAEPESREIPPDYASGLVAEADGAPGGEFGVDKVGDLGGHTLLSRRPPPQGRRSLFRR